MKFTQEDIATAYLSLSPKDRANIDNQARLLEMKLKQIKASHNSLAKLQFGKLQALELLFKLGRWMKDEGL